MTVRDFPWDCANCRTRRVAFTLGELSRAKLPNGRQIWTAAGKCGNCARLTVFEFRDDVSAGRRDAYTQIPKSGDQKPQPLANGVVGVAPAWRKPTAPKGTPDEIAKSYLAALHSLDGGYWSLAGTGLRTALERATTKLGFTNAKLAQRIDAMRDDGRLTRELAEFAHHIRGLGNNATHDLEDITEREAHELAEFVNVFLFYVYTLPAMLEEAKQYREQPPNDAPEPKRQT